MTNCRKLDAQKDGQVTLVFHVFQLLVFCVLLITKTSFAHFHYKLRDDIAGLIANKCKSITELTKQSVTVRHLAWMVKVKQTRKRLI